MPQYVPTLTSIFSSSSEARLPPPVFLLTLKRLELRVDWKTALKGRVLGGDAGGELASEPAIGWTGLCCNALQELYNFGVLVYPK